MLKTFGENACYVPLMLKIFGDNARYVPLMLKIFAVISIAVQVNKHI